MKRFSHTLRRLAAGASIAFAATAFAQDKPQEKPPETNAPAVAAVAAPAPAPATATTNAAPVKSIRLQFEGIPYSDVIERFSQMAGKPLVSDTNVVGTLTYNDPKPYTYPEALDTLNIMLAMKGVMLVETGNYLRLVPFKQLPSMPIKIMRGSDPTGDSRPSEVVTVVLEVNNIDSKEVADAVTSMLSNAGSVAALSRGRGLIVTDRLENIQRVRTLLRTIDTEASVDRQMKTYTLLHASGAILTDLLNRTFGVATAPKRTQFNTTTKGLDTLPPDPNDYITAVYDDASRTIVLFGPHERITLAEELINKFESKEGAGGDVRIYYPQTIKPTELASMIRQAVPGVAAPNETASAAATKARLITDETQNRLIVAAPIPGQLEEIERLISRIDKGAVGQGNNGNVPMRSQTVQLTKVFRPRSSEVTNVAAILTQALTRRSANGSVITSASISQDLASQSVVVSGSPGDLQIASDIVTQLETGSSQPTPMRTRFINVGNAAEAKRIAPLVEQLYRNQVGNGLGGAVAHAKIIPDAEAGRLIVTASEDHLARVEELVKQLREGHDQPQARRLQILKLSNIRVEASLPSIQNVVNDKMAERPYTDLPKPSLLADSVNNRLLITGTETQIAEIEQVVKIFDIAPEKETMEMRPIRLQAKTAAEVIPMVTQILEQTKDANSNPQSAPKLVSDATGRQILAIARAKDFDRIEALVMQFDTTIAASAPRQFRPIDLFGHGATELTPLVQQLYTEQMRGQPEPAGGAATLIADPKANRIMVSGSEKEIVRVEAIIRQLDTEEKKPSREETRVLRLKVASAAEIVGLIDKSINAQQQKVRVLLDARSNSIILSGDSASLEAASQMIQQLDARPNTGPKEMRVIELKAAEAAVITPMITTMFAELMRDQRGTDFVSQSKIIPDATANRLVVTGVKEEIDQIASLVQQLDQAPEQAPGARVFKLVNADAVMLAPIVTQAMLRYDSRGLPLKRVTVSADDKANALIVSGSRSDLADVASVIEKLDSESGVGGKDRILRIFDVKSEDTDALAALVLKVFAAQNPGRNTPGLVNITPEAAGKRLIVMASTTVMAQVETVIQTLDSKPDQGARELATIELKNATAAELLPKVSQIYAEQSQGKTIKPATIYPDASGSRFSVFGTKEQTAQIRQIIDTLESQARVPRETKIFEVGKLAEAQRLIPLATQLYRDKIGNDPQMGAADAGFMTDNRTGRLIVTARANQMKIIDDVFGQLLTAAFTNAPARETRTFEVGNASDVQRLLPLVQQLYTEQWKDKIESDPADAQIVADARTGRLIVTGKPAHLQQIDAILKQLGAGAAKPEARDTRIFELTTASAVELATTVRTLYLEQGKARFGALPPDTLITPDTGGNRLIVVGETNELNAVEDIVRKLDKVGAQSSTARVFKIKSADPDKVQEILQASLVRYDAYGRPQRRATVSVDGKSRTLIVTGDPKELQGVATIIEQLDSSLGSQTERKMKVVPLKQGRVGEISAKLRQLYQDQVRNQPELGVGDALILEDAPSNQLMLAGSEKQLAMIEKIIEEIQAAQAALSPRDTKMIDIGEASEVTRLAPLIQQLYQERWRDKSPTDPADAMIMPDLKNARFVVTARTNHLAEIEGIVTQLRAGKTGPEPRETQSFEIGDLSELTRVRPLVQQLYLDKWRGKEATDPADATIMSDDKNARLLVTARASHLKEIESILAKIATPATNSEPRDTRVFELNTASASDLAPTVQSLYRENIRGRTVSVFGQANIMPDISGNRLIVTGSSNELSSVESIISKLDQTTTKSGGARVFKLKNAQADQVATVLSASLVDFRPGGMRIPRVSVGQDLQNNMLIVSGPPKDLQSAAVIVEQLDSVPAKEPRQMHIVALKNGVASEVALRVKSLYQDQVKGIQGGGVADAIILSDDTSGRLIVTASEVHMKLIEEIVGKLQEAGDSSGRQMRVIVLQRNAASSISQMLNQLFAKQVASKDPADRLIVSPSTDERTLVIEASAKVLENVQELVTKLDVATDNLQNVIQTVHLTKGNANALAQAVSAAVATRSAPAQRVTVTPVFGANSLLLSGPNAGVEEVTKIIRELDQESSGGEIEVRIFKLENGNVREIQGVLNQLLETVTRSIARREGDRRAQFTISVNERDHTLIISGVEAHFKVVEKILPTLDKAPERSDRDVQFVWLKKAKAYDVVSKVEAVFTDSAAKDRPVIEADPTNNSITIIARRGDMAQIQDLIQRLDDTAKDSSLQVRLRPLERVGAEQMARMLQNIYPQMSKGRLRVVEKVTGADTNAPAGNPATGAPTETTAPDAAAPATEVASASQTTNAIPEVVIAIDKESNALVLSGPAQELDHIDRIITDLSYSFYGNESEFRLFALKEADPVVVARTLSELLKVEPVQFQGGPGQGPRVIQPQAPKITIVSEPRTRSIIVRARPTDFTLIESILKQLDVGNQNAQIEYRLVALTNAPPEKVLPLVQQMVTQLNATRPGEPLTVSLDSRGRGIMVIAREAAANQVEKMIRSLDSPSAYVEAGVMVINLKKANAAQLSAVLQNMLKPGAAGEWTSEARELQEQVRRLKIQNDKGGEVVLDLTKPIKISADPIGGGAGGNRLILTSTADNLKGLSEVVAMMDTPSLIEGVETKILTLKNADASTVSQQLTTIFQQAKALGAGPGGPAQPDSPTGEALSNPIAIAVDARSNALILSAQAETLDLATKIVSDLDKAIDRFTTEVKLFRLKHASALRMVPMLQSVFAEGPNVPGTEGLNMQVTRLRALRDTNAVASTEAPKLRASLVIQADDPSNTLIIAARSDALPLIKEIIEQLDIPAASGLETVRIYPLNHSDPATLQRILLEMYTGARAATMRPDDRPVISIDERTNALIVAGNSKAFLIVEALLQQLDQKLPFELRDVKIIPLENTDAGLIAANIQRLMDARITQRAASNRGATDNLKVTIIPDNRSNSLLVAGSRDSFEMVESLAKQLDKTGPALSGKIRLIPLEFADSRVIASTLTTLFTQRYAAARTPDVARQHPIILPDPRSNSLLVTANQEDNVTIDDLLKKLDTKTTNPSLELVVLPLKHNDSARVSTMLESIFAARQRAQTLPGQTPLPSEQIEVQPDGLNNALIISASKENLSYIKDLLEKIDVEPSLENGLLQTFVLQFADAQRVATMLRGLIAQGIYRPGRPIGAGAAARFANRDALAISVDPRSNTLLVSASPENLELVREIIRRVDTKDYSDATNVRVYVLKNARASSLGVTLQQFFLAKDRADAVAVNATERSIPVSVIPDDRTNSLLVTGTKEAFDAAERIISQLDGEGIFARLNFRVFPLKKATAATLQRSLQQIFQNRPPRVKGEPNDPITIVADAWVNALLVAANVEDLSTVEGLIKQLDAEPTDTGIAVHVFPLAKADARRVATTIQSLFRENATSPTAPGAFLPVSVNADERINAIVVSCGETDAKRIGELVKKLDTEQVARVSEIKVFPLRFARADSLSTLLNSALNTKPVALTEQSPNAQSVLQFITRSAEGKDLITAALKEAVLITPDARMNSLIVSGPTDYMGLIEQIVERLDQSSPQIAKIKVFALHNADAQNMAQLLMQLFRMTAATAGAGPNAQRSIQYTLMRAGLDGDEAMASATVGTAEQSALSVTVDLRTNSLLVGGTDHYVALVSQIIENLDATEANERKTEVVRLKNSQASEVALAIRTFLDQERTRVTTTLSANEGETAQRMLEREVAVVAEPISNTLLVSASPRYFKDMRALIEELDRPQPQVLIQIVLAEVTLDGAYDLGVEWAYTGKKGNSTYGVGTDFNVAQQLTQFGGFSSAISGSDFNFLLRALKEDGRLEVLSRPQIVTLDNKPATINVGQRIPLITDSRVTPQNDTINSFRYEDVGVNMTVTPKINPDGFVKIEVTATNSALSSSSVEINKSATVPIINQRRASTTVTVQSGQTVIIGGLIETTDDKRVKKIPVLANIPGIGALFRSTTSRRGRKELLILLTPQVLENTGDRRENRSFEEITRENLDRSHIRDRKRDELQKEILEPLFPEMREEPVDPSKEGKGAQNGSDKKKEPIL
jgi:type II secretory pathway component GspD/PulD (secretin)